MKGKIAFLFGASLGYVLGARAGRKRYEQIKTGAIAVWETPPVQRCADTAKSFVSDLTQSAQNFIVGKSKQVLHSATKPSQADQRKAPQPEKATAATESKTATAKKSSSGSASTKSASAKSASTKSGSTKSASTKSESAKSGSAKSGSAKSGSAK